MGTILIIFPNILSSCLESIVYSSCNTNAHSFMQTFKQVKFTRWLAYSNQVLFSVFVERIDCTFMIDLVLGSIWSGHGMDGIPSSAQQFQMQSHLIILNKNHQFNRLLRPIRSYRQTQI